MFFALRRSSCAPLLRRLMAAMLGLCLTVAGAEQWLADPCTDDGRAAVAFGTGDTRGTGALVMMDVDPQSAPGTTSAPDQHTIHLCHCAHGHGGTLATRHGPSDRLEIGATVVSGQSDRLPPSVALEPQLRPPRVLIA